MLKITARNIIKLESKFSANKNKPHAIVVNLQLDGSYVYQYFAVDGRLTDRVFSNAKELNDWIAINPSTSVIIDDL